MSVVFDEMLNQLILQRLMYDRRTAGAVLDVNCKDGCVCLTGCVDTLEQKEAALFLVEGLTGIKEVNDRIIVRQRFSETA
jgi:osmotically-inducible protein OsmY